MLVHLFKCSSAGVYCATPNRSGDGLPAQGSGVWQYVRDIELQDGDQRLAIDSQAALADIDERGYHLVSGWFQSL